MATTSSVDYERTRGGRYEPVGGRGRNLLDRMGATDEKLAPAIARLALGIVIFPHGAQKMLGWFGGQGFSTTVNHFSAMMSKPVAVLAILIEFFCSIALIVGALSRLAALGIAAIMIGAIAMVHAKFGFFMNWTGQKAGEGFEFHLLALGCAFVVFFAGGGVGSVDRAITRKRNLPV
jgi:putative oxidoreductase